MRETGLEDNGNEFITLVAGFGAARDGESEVKPLILRNKHKLFLYYSHEFVFRLYYCCKKDHCRGRVVMPSLMFASGCIIVARKTTSGDAWRRHY